ncbi:hypothetical protein DUI87_32563 [Hirundo rustica rustica]|uniref:TNFR-Cys domain-containing protein n=1 Tax=Hirundo rustica rustica TaxID=333673 RepID=A0A3M0IQI8_HIRRU|nr:hypothetical protein DUI87_32563 [Hirundo rustica rustica]
MGSGDRDRDQDRDRDRDQDQDQDQEGLQRQVVTFEASAVTLGRRDSSDHLDLGWRREDLYRKTDGLFCQKCPAGTYIAEECKEQNGSGRCEPCGEGEYMEYPNALPWCQDCLKCREDQVEQSPCQPVRNTVCACRNGTFCPPEHPCEMCQKCQPRCPEGQEVQKPCRPDSDLQCGPATDTVPPYIIVIIVLFVLAIVFGIAFCLWKSCCGSRGDGRPPSRRPYEVVSSMFQKLSWYKSVSTEAEDNAANNHRQKEQSGTGTPRCRAPFTPFADKIPRNNWKMFGRSLGLEENDVVMVVSKDDFYDMLYKWLSREGSQASVNTLLETLDRLQLGGVAEKISSALVQDGTFQYEAS